MTQRQITFALEYVKTGIGTEAYRRAYPKSQHWKPTAVETHASALLATGKVQARVAELRARAESAAVATRQEVLAALTRIIRACPTDLLDECGCIDMTRLRACRQEIQEVTVEDTPAGRRHKVKLRDVVAAADRLAKLQGWDQPSRVDVTSGGAPIRAEVVIVPRAAIAAAAGGPAGG